MGAPVQHRKIIHVDMDAFFASVEQRDNPDLRGKPVAVGGLDRRGVVAAASYEARQFGVRSAMPSFKARGLCPELIFVPVRHDVYREISGQIREVFAEYTHLIEPLSLDEAYLDVTDNIPGIPYAWQVAKEIRAKVFERTQLTCSAGVSFNKFLAKMGSSQRKPNGQFAITPDEGEAFVAALPIGKFHGIGPVTAARMIELGIHTGADLREKSLPFLQQMFGKSGSHFFDIARAIDNRQVTPDRIRKSVGAENTFGTDIFEIDDLIEQAEPLIDKVWRHCERHDTRGRTVTLKVTFADFQQITRSRSMNSMIESPAVVRQLTHELLRSLFPLRLGIRLIGVTLSSLSTEDEPAGNQLALAL
ncbi:hypothetical protein BSY19_4718 (plasmid) [Bosea sp. RAC05]|nr:hypothetical protein BSY19_4718 [Bosea sp. RAC05]